MLHEGALELIERDLSHLAAEDAATNQPERAASEIELHFSSRASLQPPQRPGAHAHPDADARYALPELQPVGIDRESQRHGDREQAAGKEKCA
jgi:hypothetical protein